MHHGGTAGYECQVVPKVGTQRERNAGAFLAVTFLFKCGPWTLKSVTTFRVGLLTSVQHLNEDSPAFKSLSELREAEAEGCHQSTYFPDNSRDHSI